MNRMFESLLFFLCVFPSFSTNEAAKEVTVLYIRHGESEWNAYGPFWCTVFDNGCKDAKLTKKGWMDAINIQKHFKGENPEDYVFYSSPLRRAFATLVSATAKMDWAEWDTTNDENDENEKAKIPLVLRPELREVGGSDTLPKTLNKLKSNPDWNKARTDLIDHLTNYPTLPKTIKNLWKQINDLTIPKFESSKKKKADLDLQILNPLKWNEQGIAVQTGFKITNRFALDARTVDADWASKSVKYLNPTAAKVGDKRMKWDEWKESIESAFAKMFEDAVRDRPTNPRRVLIGGHSQVVFGLGAIGEALDHLGWGILKGKNGAFPYREKNHKIANGAILEFQINEKGEITSNPTFSTRCPSKAVCFEHESYNKDYGNLCTQAGSEFTCSDKELPEGWITNGKPVKYSHDEFFSWKDGVSKVDEGSPVLRVINPNGQTKEYPFVKLKEKSSSQSAVSPGENFIAASNDSEASDTISRLPFLFGAVIFLSLYVFYSKSMTTEDSEYSLLNTNGEASEI